MAVSIAIDYERCTDALACAECMRVCPTMVFLADSPPAEKFKELDRHAFKVKAMYYPSCTACMACVKVCPKNAVSITVDGRPIAASDVQDFWPQGRPPLPTPTKKAPVGQLAPVNNRIKLEEDGRSWEYDCPTAMIQEACAHLDVVERARQAAALEIGACKETLARLGVEAMNLTVELADGKYRDRTAEMVDRVALQTGINLPHRVERYVELALLSLRPQDRYNVVLATTKELRLQVLSCGIAKAVQEKQGQDVACEELCLACFRQAAHKTDERIQVRLAGKMPQAYCCEFVFTT
ncbi:MAG: hypothetical protein EPO21_11155 [Chloroflexota bacterium]|nr:MAG: hypothetical protein EPO21_11155 [Chloroflexota bacterium]